MKSHQTFWLLFSLGLISSCNNWSGEMEASKTIFPVACGTRDYRLKPLDVEAIEDTLATFMDRSPEFKGSKSELIEKAIAAVAGNASMDLRWEKQELKIKFLNGAPELQKKVMDIAKVWTQYANLRFNFGNHAPSDVRIIFRFDRDYTSHSRVGIEATQVPENEPTMDFGDFDILADSVIRGLVLHEFGHALGLQHEQNSPAFNIPWNKDSVMNHYAGTFGWKPDLVKAFVINQLNPAEITFNSFDPFSIMLYSVPPNHNYNVLYSPYNQNLSVCDADIINRMYPDTTQIEKLALSDAWHSFLIDDPRQIHVFELEIPREGWYQVQSKGHLDLKGFLYSPKTGINGFPDYINDDNPYDTTRNDRNFFFYFYCESTGIYQIRIHQNEFGRKGDYELQVKAY